MRTGLIIGWNQRCQGGMQTIEQELDTHEPTSGSTTSIGWQEDAYMAGWQTLCKAGMEPKAPEGYRLAMLDTGSDVHVSPTTDLGHER